VPLPTFVIVGAQKCGTSSLHRMLRQHPQISMSRPKELHFFDQHFDRGLEWYSAQFEKTWRHKHVGESTPVYMFGPRARSRLIETLPKARIVAILRNPVDRAYSHYWHDLRRQEAGRHDRFVPATFEAALALESPADFGSLDEEAAAAARRRKISYVGRGRYVEQLEPFVEAYGRDRVHVMLLEDLIREREAALRGLFAFLRVRKKPAAEIREVHVNRYRQPDESGKARPAKYPPMESTTRKLLVEHYRPHNERLAAWLGRDLSHWT